MRCSRFLLALVLPLSLALPARAGIIFGKHNKPNPAERVPQLIVIVKTDQDDGKRAEAAKELRDYDPVAFPDVVPILIDVLEHDAKPNVRAEAAQSLGKLRPVSQDAGWALEQATKDSSIRVRLQARSSLMGYRLSGYHGAPKPTETMTVPGNATKTAKIAPAAQTRSAVVPPASRTSASFASGETAPPPLAPIPAPVEMPKLQKAPPVEQGPDLPPGN